MFMKIKDVLKKKSCMLTQEMHFSLKMHAGMFNKNISQVQKLIYFQDLTNLSIFVVHKNFV